MNVTENTSVTTSWPTGTRGITTGSTNFIVDVVFSGPPPKPARVKLKWTAGGRPQRKTKKSRYL